MRNKSTYYLVGFGCGSLAGLLFAPKAGVATRAGIVKAVKKQQHLATKLIDSAEEAMNSRRIGVLRALKRGMPSKRVRALFR